MMLLTNIHYTFFNLYRKNTTSHQRTKSSTRLCPGVPEESMDDCCSDAPVDQGDLVEAHQESKKSPYPRSLQRAFGRRSKLLWNKASVQQSFSKVACLSMQVKKDLQAGNSVSVVIPGGCTSVVQPLDVSLNKPFKGHVRVEWLAFIEKSVTELEKQQEEEEELSDDPFASSDEDDSNDEIQRLLSRKPKPIVVKPASKQSIIDWVASAWKKIEQQPDMVAKSFVVTGIAQDLDGSENGSIRNADVQDEISAKLDNPQDTDSDLSSSDSSSDEDSDA